MSKVLITGGTGLIGRQLQKFLIKRCYEVAILSRNPKNQNEFYWNIDKQLIDEKAFENVTHIVHLAGAGIADKRWTLKRKKEIIDSRVQSVNLLFYYVKKLHIKLQGFITASGIGYYGAVTLNTIFTEENSPKNDFISDVCIKWEKASNQFLQCNIPVTILRTGVVLSEKGGALAKMNTPLFLAILGNGQQYLPWIHLYDLCSLYLLAIENSKFSGIYNAVAPDYHTNASFTKKLSEVTGKLLFPINVPSFVLKIILGELSVILLEGSRISSKKVEKIYNFQFPYLNYALQQLLRKS